MSFTVKNHQNPEDGFAKPLGPALEDIEERISNYVDAGNAQGMGVVLHDDDEEVARPTTHLIYSWYGTVEPDNLGANDVWVDTTPS